MNMFNITVRERLYKIKKIGGEGGSIGYLYSFLVSVAKFTEKNIFI